MFTCCGAKSQVKQDAVPATAGRKKRMFVLYGSQTGTAESYAKMLGMYASSHGLEATVCTLDDAVELLAAGKELPDVAVFICSTYGTGEFPSNAKLFWKLLSSGQLKRLAQVPHAIFGLGNSHNENFNAAAKHLAQQLTGMGSPSKMQMQLSCELQPNGHDGAFRTWKSALWKAIGATATQGRQSFAATYAVAAGTGVAEKSVPRAGFVAATVHANALRTPEGHVPRSRLLSLTVELEAQRKQLGRAVTISDNVQIFPRNSESLVSRAIKRLGLAASDVVVVTPLAGAPQTAFLGRALTVQTLLTEVVDLSGAPSRSVLESLSMVAESPAEAERLESVAGDLSASGEYDKLTAGVFTIVDALEMFPSARLTLGQLLTVVPHISARSYSIARSIDDAAAGKTALDVDIFFNVPTRSTADGRKFEGLCTSMLDKLTAGERLMVRFEPSDIALPRDDAPLLLIALGTGIGAARALLQRRFALARGGKAVGPAKLFYGVRTEKDCMFRSEFEEMSAQAPGFLEVVYALSTEGPRAMDRMDESLVAFVGREGHVTYCGLGGSAPLALESNLRRCGFDVAALRKEGRLHEEFFTADVDSENLFKNATTSDAATTLAGKMGKCDMFCFQCEQTFKGRGCSKVGVCGKTPRVAALQDLTVEGTKVIGFYATELRRMGEAVDAHANRFTLYALFSTLTNVNFDETRFVKIVAELKAVTDAIRAQYRAACKARGVEAKRPLRAKELPATLPTGASAAAELEDLGRDVSVLTRFTDAATQSAAGVSEMLVYGLKGIAAYADHSLMNGRELPEIYEFMHRALAFMTTPDQYDLGKGLELCIEAGKINVATMQLLYESNSSLGVPTVATAVVKPRAGKAILISGHDLIILKALLEKTEPLGIDVYTHGEMLPAHSYPLLKAHKNLAGHFGGAWMRQAVEFPHFPGPVLMTTNCLTEPHETYAARIFTAGAVGWKGIPHIGNTMRDIEFDAVIRAAQAAPGFGPGDAEFAYADPSGVKRPPSYTVGFGHETILSVAPTVVEEIKKGNITRFFLVGGCDGYEGERSYYTDLVARLPKTAVVLTVGCGKFRFNHMNLGTIGETGIPRILDMGQCNDSFSAVQVALALAKVLECQVSDLPLSIVLSWFEQKAVAVLLSCLALGLKPIHVGPALPAFVTPDVLNVLVSSFGIRALGDVNEDLRVMLAATGAS